MAHIINTAAFGRLIMTMQEKIDDLERMINNLCKQLAMAREALRIALKELDSLTGMLHVHGMTPKHWPIAELVEARKILEDSQAWQPIAVSGGISLPPATPGDRITIKNDSDTDVKIYVANEDKE